MSLYQQFSDKELLELLTRDDRKAFTEIYERYHSLLYIYADKKINDKTESIDIVQDVLLNIWNKRYELQITGQLNSYLFTAIRNRILDLIAHRKVAFKYIESLQHFIGSTSSTDYRIREKELKELIEAEIYAMPPRMREVFVLSRQEWLSNSEIADKLSISQQTVETQIKRALKVLRKRFGRLTQVLFTLALFFISSFL